MNAILDSLAAADGVVGVAILDPRGQAVMLGDPGAAEALRKSASALRELLSDWRRRKERWTALQADFASGRLVFHVARAHAILLLARPDADVRGLEVRATVAGFLLDRAQASAPPPADESAEPNLSDVLYEGLTGLRQLSDHHRSHPHRGEYHAQAALALAQAVSDHVRRRTDNRDPDRPAELAGAFVEVGRRLADAWRDGVERPRLREELAAARALQNSLMPSRAVRGTTAIRVAGHAQACSASGCGGDWWAAYPLPDQGMRIVVCDVVGHGLASAFAVSAIKALCDLLHAEAGDRTISQLDLLGALDQAVRRSLPDSMRVACGVGDLSRDGRLTVAGAGAPFPYSVRPGRRSANKLRTLVSIGAPLGSSHAFQCKTTSARLRSGDAILWHTDGVVECENSSGALFGERRLRKFLIAANLAEPAAARAALLNELHAFRGDRAPTDDLTFVIVTYGTAGAVDPAEGGKALSHSEAR